jgi:hypothetical protein
MTTDTNYLMGSVEVQGKETKERKRNMVSTVPWSTPPEFASLSGRRSNVKTKLVKKREIRRIADMTTTSSEGLVNKKYRTEEPGVKIVAGHLIRNLFNFYRNTLKRNTV